MIDRYIILLCLLLIIGCDNSDKNNVLEVRKYEIGGIEKDSIWFDTLYESSLSKQNELSVLIHRIDSSFSKDQADFDFNGTILKIVGKDSVQGAILTKYTVESPTKNGYLSFYGVHASDVGTIYWRWLDGRKHLRLIGKQVSGEKYIYTDLVNYLDTTILAIPPKPKNQEYKEEVEGELELDTTLIN